jgi:hypothetical protein
MEENASQGNVVGDSLRGELQEKLVAANAVPYNRDVYLRLADEYLKFWMQTYDRSIVCNIKQILDRLNIERSISSGTAINEKTNLIVRLDHGGLCNRLRTIIGVSLVKKLFNIDNPVKVVWLQDSHCPAELSSLFDFDNSPLMIEVIGFHEYYDLISSGQFIEQSEGIGPTFYYNKFYSMSGLGWGDFMERFASESRLLKDCISDEILKKVSYFLECNELEAYTGLHIRSTDFAEHYKAVYPNRVLAGPMDFIKRLSDMEIDGPIFLSTDSFAVVETFARKLVETKHDSHSPVFSYAHRFLEMNLRQTSVESALVDLLLLSNASTLLGTYGSSFSDMASCFGGMRTELL